MSFWKDYGDFCKDVGEFVKDSIKVFDPRQLKPYTNQEIEEAKRRIQEEKLNKTK